MGKTTGYKTWDGALVTIEYLSQRPHLVCDKRVVDLSSGNGLCAIACAALGARRTVATEIPACTPLIDRNIHLNADRVPGSIESCDYWWGSELPDMLQNADIILASDILYESVRDSLQPLLRKTLLDLCSCELHRAHHVQHVIGLQVVFQCISPMRTDLVHPRRPS